MVNVETLKFNLRWKNISLNENILGAVEHHNKRIYVL